METNQIAVNLDTVREVEEQMIIIIKTVEGTIIDDRMIAGVEMIGEVEMIDEVMRDVMIVEKAEADATVDHAIGKEVDKGPLQIDVRSIRIKEVILMQTAKQILSGKQTMVRQQIKIILKQLKEVKVSDNIQTNWLIICKQKWILI